MTMVESSLLFGDFTKCENPVLSIMIPTYGRAEYLEKAVDSAICQNFKGLSYEILIVSNDPKDSMQRIISKYSDIDNLFIYRNFENIGMVGNSNRCAELARGRYLAFLHDDDYLLPGYLEEIYKQIIEKKERKCFITGRYVYFAEDCTAYRNAIIKQRLRSIFGIQRFFKGKTKTLCVEDNLYAATNCYLSPSCGTVIDKTTFFNNGGFDNNIPYSWDWDFFLHLNLKEKIYAGYKPVAVYRISNNASLRSEVKYDFFDYNRKSFIELLNKNNIGRKYIEKNYDEIVATMYVQWPEDIGKELQKRGEPLPNVNKRKQTMFRIRNRLYFYFHNLDFQKALIIDKKK